MPVEQLESRTMLTVSTASWIDPLFQAGTAYTIQSTGSSDQSTNFTTTNKGPTTYNGTPCTEFDITNSVNSGVGITYAGMDGAGDYIQYGDSLMVSTSTTTSTQTDTYTPYQVLLPASLTAGVPVTETDSDAYVLNSSTTGNSTVTYTDTNVFTLMSETPTSITVPAGTFSAYEVQEVDSSVGSDGSTSGPDTEDDWYAPGYGAVKGTDPDGDVGVLINFTGTVYHLAATTPTLTLLGDPIPAVHVSIQDQSGATDTKAADAVTITASIAPVTGTSTGTLSGTTSVTTVDGVASFSDLSINKPGQYILNFTDSAGRTVSTGTFSISAGKLRFKAARVSNGVAGSALDPAVEIELVNSKGKIITDAPSLVILSIGATNATDPTITGNTADLVNGVAVFSSIKLGVPGNYTLNATDDQGDTTAVSNQFEITGLHLAFRKEPPPETAVNAPLKYEIVVEDARNRLVNTSSIGLLLTLNIVEGGTNAALSSSADTVDFGVANNSGSNPATINSPGTYTITFQAISQSTDGLQNTITPITTGKFEVAANHLEFVKPPHSRAAGGPLTYEIAMKNYRNQTVETNTDQLQFTLIPAPGQTTGGVLSQNVDTLVGGIATNSNNLISISTPGSYKLSVVDIPPSPTDPVAKSVTCNDFFKIFGSK